jgi:hypothetical protein
MRCNLIRTVKDKTQIIILACWRAQAPPISVSTSHYFLSDMSVWALPRTKGAPRRHAWSAELKQARLSFLATLATLETGVGRLSCCCFLAKKKLNRGCSVSVSSCQGFLMAATDCTLIGHSFCARTLERVSDAMYICTSQTRYITTLVTDGAFIAEENNLITQLCK